MLLEIELDEEKIDTLTRQNLQDHYRIHIDLENEYDEDARMLLSAIEYFSTPEQFKTFKASLKKKVKALRLVEAHNGL